MSGETPRETLRIVLLWLGIPFVLMVLLFVLLLQPWTWRPPLTTSFQSNDRSLLIATHDAFKDLLPIECALIYTHMDKGQHFMPVPGGELLSIEGDVMLSRDSALRIERFDDWRPSGRISGGFVSEQLNTLIFQSGRGWGGDVWIDGDEFSILHLDISGEVMGFTLPSPPEVGEGG